MKKVINNIILAAFVCIVLPVTIFFCLGHQYQERSSISGTEYTAESRLPEVTVHTVSETEEPVREYFIKILNREGNVENRELEEYLVGVVLGEMPVSFSREALKAQAVVARTFTLRRAERMDKHDSCAVCMNPGCCQAYLSPDAFIAEKGGSQEDVDRVRECVLETAGQVLTYENEYIEATYFSASGGRTEDAVAVWGSDVPYLKARDCPGEEDIHEEKQSMTPKQLSLILNLPTDRVNIDYVVYTAGNGVDEISISGKKFSGTEVRSLLSLDSTMFRIETAGNKVIITSRGYGHRVGMSQYGADAMAKNGADYGEILSYFYPGTELHSLWTD